MPNVGKSSLVTATSTGTPEINMYPFTTRSLKMGHVITPGHRYQLMDTPGVLRREEDERNAMEGLTLASAPYNIVIAPFHMHSMECLPLPRHACCPRLLQPFLSPCHPNARPSPRPNPSPGRLPLLR